MFIQIEANGIFKENDKNINDKWWQKFNLTRGDIVRFLAGRCHWRKWKDELTSYYRDDHGFSLLHWAAKEGHLGIVEMLVARGARINATNLGDDIPLHLAAAHGHRDIVSIVSTGNESQYLLTCFKGTL